MRRLKEDRRKSDVIIIVVMLLLTLLIVVVALLGWGHPTAQPGQATGTIATETAREQLIKLQRDNDRSVNAWVWNSGAAILSSLFSTLVIVSGALIAFWRWHGDQRIEREKRAEERFQKVVEGLGSERTEAKVGAAIALRTFLGSDPHPFLWSPQRGDLTHQLFVLKWTQVVERGMSPGPIGLSVVFARKDTMYQITTEEVDERRGSTGSFSYKSTSRSQEECST